MTITPAQVIMILAGTAVAILYLHNAALKNENEALQNERDALRGEIAAHER